MALLFAADDKFADVVAVLEARGWGRLPYVGCPKAHLKWTNYSKLSWPRVAPTQLVNHFQHAVLFSRKDQFAALLYAHGAGQNGGQVSVDGCFPRTFDLSQLLDQRRLQQWFLYSRAVAVLKQSGSAARVAPEVDRALLATAMALARRVLSNERAFTDWRLEETAPAANNSEKEGSLDVDATEWQPLLSTPTEFQAFNREDSSTRREVDALLEQLTQRDPQITAISSSLDRSVWICKPANLSQGRGIVLCTSLEELEALSNTNQQDNQHDAREKQQPSTAAKWIVQKYVEQPLLLQHGRKFDIRQWVLVTAIAPEPTAFWYHRSYLRFCGRKFSLSRLQDRFTHLSNYSVQRDFVTSDTHQEAGKLATGLQSSDDDGDDFELMWSSERARETLRQEYGRDLWTETLVPQMQSTTRLALRAVLPKLKAVGRGFEWLGFDFLVDETHRVWLLEVNVSPDVSHSTSVTAELVPDATNDALSLILDSSTPRAPDNGWLPFSLE